MNHKKLSQLLIDVNSFVAKHENFTLQKLVEHFTNRKGYALFIFIIILPFTQPIPFPGLSTPIGLLISVLAYFILMNKAAYLPKKLGQKQIPRATMLQILHVAQRICKFMERFIKPRLTFLFASRAVIGAVTFCMAVCGVLLALSLPIPFSNTVPGLTVAAFALGLLEDDGIFILLGFLGFLFALLFFTGLIVGPVMGIEHFFKG